MLDLAVIIVNYNTRDLLRSCLQSLHSSIVGSYSYRAVVVDNCSVDGSANMVRAEQPWVSLITSDHNGGYAFANNLGLRAMGYGLPSSRESLPRYVLLLNPDTVLPPGALAQVLTFMDAHVDVGVLGPKLVREDGSFDRACRRSFPTPAVSFYRMSGLSRLFPKSKRFGQYNLSYLDIDTQADVDAVVGAFMLMRCEVLEQAGLLDETFFMYGEDLDLCYRIKQRGWRVVYYPAVTVLHIKGASSRQSSARTINAFYDAMAIFHSKHYRQQTFFLFNWTIDLGIALLRKVALLQDRLRPPARKRVASA
jgi:N-acetylglucosaminyl-diphospho-decaprenol L-rhamnosyltransferase